MQNQNLSNLNFRALVILGVISFALYLAAERGLLGLALSSDRSYISYIIVSVYVIASLHWLWVAHILSRERGQFALLEHIVQSADADFDNLSEGAIGRLIQNCKEQAPGGDTGILVSAFGDELSNRHALGHFISDALLKLGLLGTIVGFILMLLPIGELKGFEASGMQQLLSQMSGGMGVALYTTLAGLVTSTLLKFQYHVLDASVADLVTRVSVTADLHLTKDAS